MEPVQSIVGLRCPLMKSSDNFIFIYLFIYTIFKEDTQLASKASLPCGPL